MGSLARTARRLACVVAVVLGAVVAVAQPAAAVTYLQSGSFDMRGFISSPTPLYGCGAGGLNTGGVVVRGPSNWSTARVFATVYAGRYNSATGGWDAVNLGTDPVLVKNGVYVKANQSVTMPGLTTRAVARGYYYRMVLQVQYLYGSTNSYVHLRPTSVSDYSAATKNVSGGWSYCYVP